MNLIIDPLTHSPYLKYVIPNSLYYTEDKYSHYPSGHYSKQEFKKKYNFSYEEDINKINKIENLFIIIPVLSLVEKHQGYTYIKWVEKFTSLYDKYKPLAKGKVIIFDNHGGDHEPIRYLKDKFSYDKILKRVYSNRNKKNYSNIIYPYPMIMDTINDPLFNLINKTLTINNNKINKIYWSGSLFDYHENFDDKNVLENANRKIIVYPFIKKYRNILEIKKVPYENFLNTISNYKYSLDIRGTSRLNKRLFEILSTNSLLLAEKIDVVWPFDEGDKLSDECFFEQGNIDDLYRIYNNFENDICLYHRCLENQIFIVKKYFNKEWLWNYIESIIS